MRHAVDREGDGADVELSGEDGATQLLYDVFEGVPVLADHSSVIQGEPSIFVSARVPVVILQIIYGLPCPHQIKDLLFGALSFLSFFVR